MDVVATLIEISAYDVVAQAQKTVRVTNRNDPRATTYNDFEWLPVLNSAPTLGLSVFNGDFTGAGDLTLGGFTLTLIDGIIDTFTRLMWHGASVKVYAGPLGGGTYPLLFTAVGNGATRQGRQTLSVELTTRSSLLNGGLLLYSYAGTGGVEGDISIKGVVKPWAFGYARFCKPVLIDPVRQIYQVHAYGPVEKIDKVYEGGAEIAPGATFTAAQLNSFLTGAGPAQGTWDACPSSGLIRLGSQPIYALTCDVYGDTGGGATALTKIGDIVQRVMTLTTTLTLAAGTITAFNTAETHVVNAYVSDQTSINDFLTTLLLSVGGYYTFDETGGMLLGRVLFGSSSMNLSGTNDQEPTVLGINQLATSAPVWYLRVSAEQCQFVHSAADTAGIIQTIIDDLGSTVGNTTFPPSNTPPTGAIDGDLWPDTSSVPTIMRRYKASNSTWVAVSNLVTQGTDIGVENGATYGAPGNSPVGSSTGNAVVSNITNVTNRTVSLETITGSGGLLRTLISNVQGNLDTSNANITAQFNTISSQLAGTAASGLKSSITTAQTTATNAGNSVYTLSQTVTTLTSTISALGSPNLIQNGAFTQGFSGWAGFGSTSWSYYNSGSFVFAQSSMPANTNSGIYTDVPSIQENKPYCLSYEGEHDSGSNGYMQIQWWSDGYGSYLGTSPATAITNSGWGNRVNSGPFTAPTNARIARVVFYAGNSGNGIRRITKILLQQSNAPTPYVDSSSLTSLQAQVTQQAGTLAILQGKLLAYWQTETTVAGYTAFITARADYNGNTGSSDVAIGAKVFMVYNPSGANWLKTLEVSGGNVRIYGNLAVDGSVTTNNLQDGSVTRRLIMAGGGNVWNGDGSTEQTVFDVNVTLDYAASVTIRVSGGHSYSGGSYNPWQLLIYWDNTILKSVGGTANLDLVTIEAPKESSSGSHNIKVKWVGTSNMQLLKMDGIAEWNYK